MNLIALETLTAYIYLEIQALQVLTAYQIRVKGYNTYTALAHKINRALIGCTVVYFRLYLTDLECFDTVQQIDLELPIMNEIISAYVVIHSENNTHIECASYDRAVSVCNSLGVGYSVICKYWIDNCFVYDNQVYICEYKASLSILVLQYLARFEIVCIEMLLFWFCQSYDPNNKVYKDASLLDEIIFNHKYERYPVLYGHRHNSDIFTRSFFALTV